MKALTRYLQKREAAIHSLLKKPRHKYSSGTFHKLRVEIKKLNALLELIAFGAQDFAQEQTFSPFKHIFRLAGAVRELQIEEAMLKKYLHKTSLKPYRKELKTRRLKAQENFFKVKNKKMANQLKKAFQKITPFLSEVTKIEAIRYLTKNKTSIKDLMALQQLEVEQVHELRMRIKIYNYNRQSLKLKKKTKNEVVLSELLGKWHDCQLIISNLQQKISCKELDPEECRQLENTKTELAAKSKRLFAKINKAIPVSEFFGSASKAIPFTRTLIVA